MYKIQSKALHFLRFNSVSAEGMYGGGQSLGIIGVSGLVTDGCVVEAPSSTAATTSEFSSVE